VGRSSGPIRECRGPRRNLAQKSGESSPAECKNCPNHEKHLAEAESGSKATASSKPNNPANAKDINERTAAESCDDEFMDYFVTDKDPDEDVEERINKEIRKTISQVLSQIVEEAISGSIKDTVELDDGENFRKRIG
jgi:hypothetical protein